jgi:hypothetical protein
MQNYCYVYFNICRPQGPAARSKAWTVFARSNTGIACSNTTRGMDACVRLFCVYVAVLRWADPPSKELYQLCIDLDTEKAAKVHKGCKVIHTYFNMYALLGPNILLTTWVLKHRRSMVLIPPWSINSRCHWNPYFIATCIWNWLHRSVN